MTQWAGQSPVWLNRPYVQGRREPSSIGAALAVIQLLRIPIQDYLSNQGIEPWTAFGVQLAQSIVRSFSPAFCIQAKPNSADRAFQSPRIRAVSNYL